MTPSPNPACSARLRLLRGGEWLVVLGLAATLAWTTLCLGGYLAETMIVTAWGVFALAALAGGLWLAGRDRDGHLSLNRAALLPLPFLAYALASVLWLAPAKWLAWREWLLWLQMWLVFTLTLHFVRSRRQIRVIVGVLAGLALTGVALAAYQRYVNPRWLMLGWVHGWFQADQFAGRSSGMFGVPNSFAGLLELVTPAALAVVFSRSTSATLKVAGGWLSALFIFAMVLTASRGGWISLGLVLLGWPLLGARDWRRRMAGAALTLLLLGAGLAALDRFSDRAHERIQPFLEGKFEASRPLVWQAGWQIWRDHPWIGSGAASFNVVFDQYRPPGFANEPDWTHNDYLNTLSDYGAVGFLLWAGAGAWLLGLGWRAVRRTRRADEGGAARPDLFSGRSWRLGLWLGLVAFALHLAVDFHTKVPALAFAAAVVMGLLLRDDPDLAQPLHATVARGLGLGVATLAVGVAGWIASPLYRAEARRYLARREMDRNAVTRQGDFGAIVRRAEASFAAAVAIDPGNGQAWSDLSYAMVESWRLTKPDLVALGRRAAGPADRAIALCPVRAEFWVRKGVALDMQGLQPAGEICFRRAIALAPATGLWWYHLAYHLSALPGRKAEALQAVATGLALDPSISAAVTLRQQLSDPAR